MHVNLEDLLVFLTALLNVIAAWLQLRRPACVVSGQDRRRYRRSRR